MTTTDPVKPFYDTKLAELRRLVNDGHAKAVRVIRGVAHNGQGTAARNEGLALQDPPKGRWERLEARYGKSGWVGIPRLIFAVIGALTVLGTAITKVRDCAGHSSAAEKASGRTASPALSNRGTR